MIDFTYPVECPLMGNQEIKEEICFDIHMVVDGSTPEYTAPEEIFKHENYVEICNQCRYHRND